MRVLLQAASWYQDFRKVEDKLRKLTGDTFQLQESIKQKETESNYKPIITNMRALLSQLNDKIVKAL